MPSLRFTQVSFSFHDAAPLLTEVSLHLSPGWTGLVGENGSGKTTLLQLVSGTLTPTEGSIAHEDTHVMLCAQNVHSVDASIENLCAADDRDAHRLKALLHLRDDDLARWPTLSPGERKRWQVGAAVHAAPGILLLDEPTNHLDFVARDWLLKALQRYRGIGIVVSHDRTLLDELTSQTVWLHQAHLQTYPGAYSKARELRDAETKRALALRQSAQDASRAADQRLNEARRARDSAERAMSGRHRDPNDSDSRTLGAKTRRAWAEQRLAANVHRLRGAAQNARDAIADTPISTELGKSVFMHFQPAPKTRLLDLNVDELKAGEHVVLREVHLQLNRTDRIRIHGPNGSGKSTLVNALLKSSRLPCERLLYLPQELPQETGPQALEAVRALAPETRGRVLSLVAALGSDPDRLLASEEPSPGETRKLLLALGLGTHVWAAILDEPTNHLDVPTIERLETALAAFPGAVLLVTHDDAFAAKTTTVSWNIERQAVLTSQQRVDLTI